MKTPEYKCHTCVHGAPLSCDSPIYCDDNNSGYEPKQTDDEAMTVAESEG